MKYTVKRIDEDLDFGCEEKAEGAPVMAVVTLADENGLEQKLRQPDQFLYDRDINEGDCVILDEKGELQKSGRKTVRVVAAVIHDHGKIFATQRGYGDYKDWWEFPGGKIELGETSAEALKREISEELDTEISVGELIDTVEYDYPGFHLSMECFWCEVVSGDLVLREHEAAKWLDRESLNSLEWLPADKALIGKIKTENRPLS